MLKILYSIFFFYSFYISSYGQKQDNIWVVGGYSGEVPDKPDFGMSILDFSSRDSIKSFSPMDKGFLHFSTTCSSICDKNGKLALYTDGIKIENGNFDFIPSQITSTSLMAQSTLLLPLPEKDSLYFMLHERPINNPNLNDLSAEVFYIIIDMSKNEGKGELLEPEKRVPKVIDEYYPCLGKLCAIKQSNGIDWWIFIMEQQSNVFYRYALTKQGFSYVDKQIYGKPIINSIGTANFSPNGKYHARYNNLYSNKEQYLDVYDFDRCTGKFSNQRSLSYINRVGAGAGIAFSPNSRYLYVCRGVEILQYDMEAANFKASEKIVAQYDGFITCNANKANFYNCQLAPDNKIYICTSGCSKHLHVIEKPDLPDTLCQVKQHGIELPTYILSSLPNFPNFRLGKAECKIGVEEEIENGNILIYPNPAQQELSISYKNNIANSIVELSILNSTGVIMAKHSITSENTTLDINHLPNGIYQVLVKDVDKVLTTQKLVIIK